MSALLAGCTSGGELQKPRAEISTLAVAPSNQGPVATSGAEFFSEDKYGVQASPRVASLTSAALNSSFVAPDAVSGAGLTPPPYRLKRGGGRAQLGKPYTVRGKRFTPRHEPDYNRTGLASWYGTAFHGRLTANGEVYDMNHLSAAHPTLPLPSYARVTNVNNGASVIVRINDRGPFAHNRVIDLSRRAAQALGTTKAGVATVNVQYIGPAPVHGEDDAYLLSSFRPAGSAAINNDIASLPTIVGPVDEAISVRRPSNPLSFTRVETAPFSSIPYSVNKTIIHLGQSQSPQNLEQLSTFGTLDVTQDGAHLVLDKFTNPNEALRKIWAIGYIDAMLLRDETRN